MTRERYMSRENSFLKVSTHSVTKTEVNVMKQPSSSVPSQREFCPSSLMSTGTYIRAGRVRVS